MITIHSSARSLYRSLVTLPDPFKQVQHELASLIAVLDTAQCSFACDCTEGYISIEQELQSCEENLQRLRMLYHDIDGSDSRSLEISNRKSHAIEEIGEIRQRISWSVQVLISLNTSMIQLVQYHNEGNGGTDLYPRKSQNYIKQMLKTFIDDVNRGKRPTSIFSNVSLSSSDKETWEQLRKELQSAGISPHSFSHNFDLIIATLKKDGFGDDIPDLGRITQHLVSLDLEEPSNLRSGHTRATSTKQASQDTSPMRGSTSTDNAKQFFATWGRQPFRIDKALLKALGARDDLISCAEDGDLRSVMQKLDQGADMDASNSTGETALSLAAANGHKEIVLLLFTKGANVDAMNNDRETAVIQAAKNGHADIVKVLLSHEGQQPNDVYEAALKMAATNGHESVVRLLLENAVNANAINPHDENDNTALYHATTKGHLSVVRLLLDYGVDTTIMNYWDKSALFAAVATENTDVLRYLLKHGVKIDRRAKNASIYADKREIYHMVSDEEDARRERSSPGYL